MFGLFKKNNNQPSVTPEDKEWVEQNLIWLIKVFGTDRLNKQPFILPTPKNFPYTDLDDAIQFQQLFEQLCNYWQINPNQIIVKFFDDFLTKQWSNWSPIGEQYMTLGRYNNTADQQYQIQLAKSNLKNPELLVAVISHELAHVKLLGSNLISEQDAEMEHLTDLTSIYWGFGIFVANSSLTTDFNWMRRNFYLPDPIISYTNALICYISGRDYSKYSDFFNDHIKYLFKQDCEYLHSTNDTELTSDNVADFETEYKVSMQIEEGLDKRDFDAVIEAAQYTIKNDPKGRHGYINMGYALLQQKKYEAAIAQFTKAIDIDPYWGFSFSDRGYCKLQLGDIENAYDDIHYAIEIEPFNCYYQRNLGAYYLKVENFEKALENFEKVEEINPQTELINFYLGHIHLKLGDTDKAKLYFNKSKELNEYNDSVLEYPLF